MPGTDRDAEVNKLEFFPAQFAESIVGESPHILAIRAIELEDRRIDQQCAARLQDGGSCMHDAARITAVLPNRREHVGVEFFGQEVGVEFVRIGEDVDIRHRTYIRNCADPGNRTSYEPTFSMRPDGSHWRIIAAFKLQRLRSSSEGLAIAERCRSEAFGRFAEAR